MNLDNIPEFAPYAPLVVFHKNCPDGCGSAWWLGKHLGEHEKWAASYDDESLPSFVDREVYIVDFCYPATVLERIMAECNHLRVLDHHQTAYDILCDVTDLPLATSMDGFIDTWDSGASFPHWAVLDQNHSGVGLAARYVYSRWGESWPTFFDYIEDRDLWRFDFAPATQEAFAAVTSHPYTDEAWEAISRTPPADLLAEGRGIERYRQQLIAQIIETKHLIFIGGAEVWACASPYALGSDVAHELCKLDETKPFAAYYVVNNLWPEHETELRFGLRSLPDGADVAAIAEAHGGGGHKHAAGFLLEF